MKKRIKIHGILIALAVALLFIGHTYILSDTRSLLATANGVLLVLIGYLIRIMARGLKAELNPKGDKLITSGIYSLTRNPMYLGVLMIGLGVNLALFKWWFFVLFLAAFLAIYLNQMSKEAKALSQRFGEEYKKYTLATPVFFPCAKTILTTRPSTYWQLKSGWVRSELSSLLPLSTFIICVKVWQYLR
jgi:protein-S-isoprenylcysteine O-methyltransferase Ste14